LPNIERKIAALIAKARSLGLNDIDLQNAGEALSYFEYEIAFDSVATQMYEYENKVDLEFLRLIDEICDSLEIDRKRYSFLVELLEDKSDPISRPI
jgi:hypothetical protein